MLNTDNPDSSVRGVSLTLVRACVVCVQKAPFLDRAVRAVATGGLLCVASTEDPALDPTLCAARYGGRCFGRDAARAVGAACHAEVQVCLSKLTTAVYLFIFCRTHAPPLIFGLRCGCCWPASTRPRAPLAEPPRRCSRSTLTSFAASTCASTTSRPRLQRRRLRG